MDGRIAAPALVLALTLVSSGCITTQERKVAIRTEDEPSPIVTAPKNDAKKPPPMRVVLALADMKAHDADAIKGNPEAQARMRDEARRAYQEVLKSEPDNRDAVRGLGAIYTRMGDYDRAREVYTKALAKNGKDADLWHDLGMLHDRRRDWAEGIRCFRKGLEADAENQRCLKALGFTLARLGQLDESVQCLTRAMGSAAAGHYNVALMLMHIVEQEPVAQRATLEELARQHLRAALELDPNYEQAREALGAMNGPGSVRGTVEIQFADPAH